MATVVTVMNMKGGIGKTTVTLNVAGVLPRYLTPPLRVLVIDYDPQFNLSQAFLASNTYFALEKQKKTVLAVLIDSGTALNPYQLQVPGNHNPPSVKSLLKTVYRNRSEAQLDIIPSTLDLMYVALGQATTNTARNCSPLITVERG